MDASAAARASEDSIKEVRRLPDGSGLKKEGVTNTVGVELSNRSKALGIGEAGADLSVRWGRAILGAS